MRNESFESVVEQVERQYSLGPSAKKQQDYFGRFRGKPFYIWNKQEHEQEYDTTKARYGKPRCCFNHIIGLPVKGEQTYQLFDYERTIYDALMTQTGDIKKDKHVYVLKATGLGITEFCLRWIAWMCLYDDKLKDSQVVIIVGPRIELAITLISRLKSLFPDISFAEKETVCTLNGVRIEAFPSHTGLDAARGLKNPRIILLDEADFHSLSDAHEARAIAERYIPKSSPHIILVSTPNEPEGLMEDISKEPEDKCLYHRIFLPYTVGLGKIYTAEEIAKAEESPSFPREFNLQFIGQQGNVYSHESIERAIQMGLKLASKYLLDEIHQDTEKSMGVDPGWGSSKFAIVVTQFVPGNRHEGIESTIQVLYADEFERPDLGAMTNMVVKMYCNYAVSKIFIDGANPEIVRPIKAGLSERTDYERAIAHWKSVNRYYRPEIYMNVIPVSFREQGKEMLAHTKYCLDNSWLAIHPDHHKLLVALRTATATDGLLEKSQSVHNDLLDALRLSLRFYNSSASSPT